MDVLKNESYLKADYLSRYTGVPFYYNTEDDEYIFGLVKNMGRDIDFVSVTITQKDNLDALALKYYGNPSLWWIIAYFNNIQDAFAPLLPKYKVLQIPKKSEIYFEDAR